MKDDLPVLLTVDETAEILRTTRKGIYAMIERAQIPGVTRIGRRVLVRSDVLLRWLDQKTAPSPTAETSHSTPLQMLPVRRRK
jgi:excisionase family DNA binding protein